MSYAKLMIVAGPHRIKPYESCFGRGKCEMWLQNRRNVTGEESNPEPFCLNLLRPRSV